MCLQVHAVNANMYYITKYVYMYVYTLSISILCVNTYMYARVCTFCNVYDLQPKIYCRNLR